MISKTVCFQLHFLHSTEKNTQTVFIKWIRATKMLQVLRLCENLSKMIGEKTSFVAVLCFLILLQVFESEFEWFCVDIHALEGKYLVDWEKILEISAKFFAMAKFVFLIEHSYIKNINTKYWFIHCFLRWEILHFHFVLPIWPGWKIAYLKILNVLKQFAIAQDTFYSFSKKSGSFRNSLLIFFVKQLTVNTWRYFQQLVQKHSWSSFQGRSLENKTIFYLIHQDCPSQATLNPQQDPFCWSEWLLLRF